MALIQESLKEQLEKLIAASTDDASLAQDIVESQVWEQIIELGLKTNVEAAQFLGYSSKRSVDSMAQKAKHFPQPVISGNRWSTRQLIEWQQQHSRK